MGIARPTGKYSGPMLDPNGWPEADEDTFYDQAQKYHQTLHKVTRVLETCRELRVRVFEEGAWSGAAANTTNEALGANIAQLMTLQDHLATVITWHRHTADLIEQAKSDIGDHVDAAHREITLLEKDLALDDEQKATAIHSLVRAAHAANVGVVSRTAQLILESDRWRPPKNGLKDLRNQNAPTPNIPSLIAPADPTLVSRRPSQSGRAGHGRHHATAESGGRTDSGATQPSGRGCARPRWYVRLLFARPTSRKAR
ncbi:hypothetical protein [Mycobacterium marinum]|uniref:hypothetical protein n=1 Tax=Mycobacterium marinum TaxID=1781 RepID=UPI00235972BA|nr:hypothetical protein [Mycobacterium marinum]MDC8984750.1 hypothetical protein [Mycobacterium marinum]MDC9002002.1 hypothetical protein [Mycobacterium marinum]MDC9012775.1 hypothetical protein [Mycobacterium marinum]MDC9018305.1 hypothetical protein [Mycobacterium marinum]